MPDQVLEYDSQLALIVDRLLDGRVIPFLGAGVNMCGRPETWAWHAGDHRYLPSGGELSAYLASASGYPRPDNRELLRVSQYVALMAGPGGLYDMLHGLFDHDYPPTAVHTFLVRLPKLLAARAIPPRPLLVVTTNYDDVLERALQDAKQPFDLVSYIASGSHRGKFRHVPPSGEPVIVDMPNKYGGVGVEPRTVVLKIHGTIGRQAGENDSYVITEDDYISYLTRTDLTSLVPVHLAARLRQSHFLFLGYGLRDWNLRVILHRLSEDEPLWHKSWAVEREPEALEKRFWAKRDVDMLEMTLETFVDAVERRLAPPASASTAP